MSDAITVRVRSLQQTAELAAALAVRLRRGDVICLDGQLGAGKTSFVAELARWFGADDEITSPTFTLENRHALSGPDPAGPSLLVHCDLYRPGEDARRDLLPAMLEARDEGAILAIEWAAPVRDWLTPYLQLEVELLIPDDGEVLRSFSLHPVPIGWPSMDGLALEWQRIADKEDSR
jgi:tRNA threonylcarbamoyl adenosine modification protein YjeE